MSSDASEQEAAARGGHEKEEEVEDEESGQMSKVESLEDLEEGQPAQELAVPWAQANAAKPHLQGVLCKEWAGKLSRPPKKRAYTPYVLYPSSPPPCNLSRPYVLRPSP